MKTVLTLLAKRSLRVPALLAAVYAVAFAVIGIQFQSPAVTAEATDTQVITGAPAAPQFVGSAACADCHASEHAAWASSQHAAAMQDATDATMLGDFDGATFTKDGVTSTFFKKDGKFWVNTDGPDGKLGDFEIKYTFGIDPLQQYLIALPGGRVQALGIAWDSRPKDEGGQRWFHLYPDRKIPAGDPLHWTGIDQNWNYQCADCHSTNLKKNYDPETKTFDTTWSEINVGCEACHGPASQHVAWAAKADDGGGYDGNAKGFSQSLDERKGVSWSRADQPTATRSVPRTTAKEIEACAPCHARRQQFSDAQTPRFHDAFRPALLDRGLYHADGQQRDEVYIHGSFLQSKMNAAGVTCSDCHDPHTQKLRADGNAVCAQCHAPKVFDTPEHHHHEAGTKAAQCVSCHMPETTYMIVDQRRDHSIRIPRPDLTSLLATPNACNGCHTDKTASWAADAIKTWYPSPKPGYQDFAKALNDGDSGAPGAPKELIRVAGDKAQSPIARASAIVRLGRYPSPKALEAVTSALDSKEPLVRMAAVSALAETPARLRSSLLPNRLADSDRIVRMDAARALAGEPEQQLSPEDRKLFDSALAEYIAAQRFTAERPESHFNLANLYLARGQRDEAEAALTTAIEIDETFAPAYVALAESLRRGGDEAAAEKVLRDALVINADQAELLHALGLSLVRQKRSDDALPMLLKAAQLAPDAPRFSYVAAVALHGSGKPNEAIAMLKGALARHPYDRDLLHLLASYEAQVGDFSSAIPRAELLKELEPDNERVAQFLDSLKAAAR